MMKKLFQHSIEKKEILLLLLLAQVTGILCIAVFSSVWGWLVGNLIGRPFALYLSTHPSLYQFVQDVVRGSYVFLVVLVFDFFFTYITYFLLDSTVTRQSTWDGLLAVSFRAVKGLIKWQLLVGFVCVLVCWKVEAFSSLYLIPPFLTSSPVSSLYMALWESSLLLFACSFALTENTHAAFKKSFYLLMSHKKLWGMFVFVSFWLTLLPGLVALWLHLPTLLYLVIGIILHTSFFMGACLLLFGQDNIFTNQ